MSVLLAYQVVSAPVNNKFNRHTNYRFFTPAREEL
jgi:hypothetical protein